MALTLKSDDTCADAACTVSNGEKFTLAVEIEVAPAGGYVLAQTWIDYGIDLTYNPAQAQADEIVWPDCESETAVRRLAPLTAVAHGCLTALFNTLPSTYIGNFVELSFRCSSDPSTTELLLIPLGQPPALSDGAAFALDAGNPIVPSVRGLTVHCVAPTATPTGTVPATPTGTVPATPASSVTPMPTGVATATPPGTPVGTPAATPTGGPTATPTLTSTGTPGATPVGGATATPVTPGATPATPTATVESMSTPTLAVALVGDANCDGNVDPIDAAFILQWSARLLAALACPANADASGNGGVDPLDSLLILQFGSRLIGTLPP